MPNFLVLSTLSIMLTSCLPAVAQGDSHTAAAAMEARAHPPSGRESYAPKTIYIDSRAEAQPIKKEIVKKLHDWGGITIVGQPEQADLVLQLDQSEKLLITTGSGDRGSVVLKDRRSGEELWSQSRGGGWSMRGWSNAWVGKRLGSDLIRFLSRNKVHIDKTESPSTR